MHSDRTDLMFRCRNVALLTIVATLVVVSAGMALPVSAADSTNVELQPSSVPMQPNSTATVDLVVANANNGVGSLTATIDSNDTDVISIQDISVGGNPVFDNTTVSSGQAKIEIASADTMDSGEVSIATLTIAANQAGKASLQTTVSRLEDENANSYDVATASNSKITVSSAAKPTDVYLDPQSKEIGSSETTTYTVRVASATEGVAAVDLEASISNTTVADISSASVGGSPSSVNVSNDGDSAQISGSGMGISAGSNTAVATIELSGAEAGTTGLNLNVQSVETLQRESYDVRSTTGSTITVTSMNSGSSDPGGSQTTDVDVKLNAATNGFQQYNLTVASTEGATIKSVSPEYITGQSFQIVSGGQGSNSVTARAVDLAGVKGSFSGSKRLFTVTYSGDVDSSSVEITTNALVDDNGNSMSASQITKNIAGSGSPFSSPIGNNNKLPTDTDGDGKYEDVNGDGKATFDDALSLAFANTDNLTQAQMSALDFNTDGSVNFDDAIELAFSV